MSKPDELKESKNRPLKNPNPYQEVKEQDSPEAREIKKIIRESKSQTKGPVENKQEHDQECNPPEKRISLLSLEAEISERLAKLTHFCVNQIDLICGGQEIKLSLQSSMQWNNHELDKYNCYHFTLESPKNPEEIKNYWKKVQSIFKATFGSEAKQVFNDFITILPDGVELIVYLNSDRPTLYENQGLYFLKQTFASAQQYIQDLPKEIPKAKIDAIAKVIKEKFLLCSANLNLLLTNPLKAEQSFNLKFLVEDKKSDFIIHETHLKFVNKVLCEFDSEVIAQLALFDNETTYNLPTKEIFDRIYKQFNQYQNKIKKDDSELNRDIFLVYRQNNFSSFRFINRHQSLTKKQRLTEKAESPKLDSLTSVGGEVQRLPVKIKTSRGFFWEVNLERQSSVEVHFSLENSSFHTSHQQALQALSNLQQQAQETRRNRIIFHLLEYNQSSKPQFKLSLSSIHAISLFLSDEISFAIDEQIYNNIPCNARESHRIMMAELAKFKAENLLISIPDEVKYILGGVAKEIAQARNIYTHVYNINDQSKYQYDALRIAQYWLEYSAPSTEPTTPGFIYFLWPMEAIKPEILDNNRVGMIQLLLLFKEFYLDDILLKGIKIEDFLKYYQLRKPVIEAARDYRRALTDSKDLVKALAKFNHQEQIFLAKTQATYKKFEEKVLSSQPTNAMGIVLKIIFSLIKNNNYRNYPGLIPALIHLLVFFMNEKKGLSIQAAGGSENHDGRWELVEDILQSLQKYGLYRNLEDLNRSIDPLMRRFRPYSPERYLRLRSLEADKRPQPLPNDLLLLSASYTSRPFFVYWINEIKPSHLLEMQTKILYRYSTQHWLSLEEKLELLSSKEIKNQKYSEKDLEDLERLKRFQQRESILLQALSQEHKQNSTQLQEFHATAHTAQTLLVEYAQMVNSINLQSVSDYKLDHSPEPDSLSEPLSISQIIDYFHDRLTQFLIAKEEEINNYCSFYSLLLDQELEKILSKAKEKRLDLESKYNFIQELNLLGLSLNSRTVKKSGLFSENNPKKKQDEDKYACYQPIKKGLQSIASIKFSTQEDFIDSITYIFELLHPNETYVYLIENIKPPTREAHNSLIAIKDYCDCQQDEEKINFIDENQGRPIIELQIFWQQQKLFLGILNIEKFSSWCKDDSKEIPDLSLIKNFNQSWLSVGKMPKSEDGDIIESIKQFYKIFKIKIIDSNDLGDWTLARLLRLPDKSIKSQYQFIVDLYYLALKKHPFQSEILKQTLGRIAQINFISTIEFLKTLNQVIQYLQSQSDDNFIEDTTISLF